MIESDREQQGLAWQIGVWNRISDIYQHEIDQRFAPVVEAVMTRAALAAGESVLDLGTGTGAVAQRASEIVGSNGRVVGMDVSPDMISLAHERKVALGLDNVTLLEGRAESVLAENGSFDVVLACLSLMYVIDRDAAAREIARVLRPGGRLVAAAWASAEQCDIVLFQETAGRFAGSPPVPGVGPGALADSGVFLGQLEAAGIHARVEVETLGFDFPSFASAWNALAGVTTAHLPAERQQEAKDAVMAEMYPHGAGARRFNNATQFIIGQAHK